MQLRTISALADWYPFGSGFRTSGGLFYNKNKFTLNAMLAANNTYSIGANTYTAAQIGSLQGEISFNAVAPYIGIGWGNPVAKDKSWSFVSDLGILFQGKPKAL